MVVLVVKHSLRLLSHVFGPRDLSVQEPAAQAPHLRRNLRGRRAYPEYHLEAADQ